MYATRFEGISVHIDAGFDPTYYALREQSPLAYKYSPYPVFTLGFIWFCLWSVIAGFAFAVLSKVWGRRPFCPREFL